MLHAKRSEDPLNPGQVDVPASDITLASKADTPDTNTESIATFVNEILGKEQSEPLKNGIITKEQNSIKPR